MKNLFNIKNLLLIFLMMTILPSITLIKAGYGTDPNGDSEVSDVDIIRLDVGITQLKITLAKTPSLNHTEHSWYTYNVFVDTSGSATPSTSDEVWEYCAHFKWYYTNGSWFNESYFCTSRYWINDNYQKQTGAWWWNIQTKTWVASDPNQDVAVVSANTISFDITDAIQYEGPAGTDAFKWIKAFGNGGVDLVVKDTAPNSGWIGQNDPIVYPGKTTTKAQTTVFTLEWFVFALISISICIGFRNKKLR